MARFPADPVAARAHHLTTSRRMSGRGLLTLGLFSLLASFPTLAEPISDFGDSLAQSADRAAFWQTGWTAFYGLSLGFNAYQGSEADDAEDRYDARVSAVTAALGLGDLLINPLPRFYEKAQQRYRQAAEDSEGQGALILDVAQSERAAYRWQSRVLPGLVSGAAGLVIAIGDDRPKDGALQFATSMLVNEVKLWTRPTAVRDRANAMGVVSLELGGKRHEVELAGYLLPQGLGLVARF